jgi:F0F1-type ATP synthase assembly protein I
VAAPKKEKKKSKGTGFWTPGQRMWVGGILLIVGLWGVTNGSSNSDVPIGSIVFIVIGFALLLTGVVRSGASKSKADNQAAGWLPDPYGIHELRYFDGTSWREMVSDNGTQTVDAPPPPQP